MSYRRYPGEPPAHHRTVWALILLALALLLANIAHQAGIA